MDATKADIVKYAHLIAKLAYDDDFRETFKENPREVLQGMGFVGVEKFPEKCVLLSKERLQEEYQNRLHTIAFGKHEPGWSVLCSTSA
jgi:hypothetical protein